MAKREEKKSGLYIYQGSRAFSEIISQDSSKTCTALHTETKHDQYGDKKYQNYAKTNKITILNGWNERKQSKMAKRKKSMKKNRLL